MGDFLVSIWDRRKQLLYVSGSAFMTRQNNPTPECVVNGTECYDSLSMSDLFIYLFVYASTVSLVAHVLLRIYTIYTYILDAIILEIGDIISFHCSPKQGKYNKQNNEFLAVQRGNAVSILGGLGSQHCT